MTPHEYIAEMKARYPSVEVAESDIPTWMKSQVFGAGDDAQELLARVNRKDWAEFLVDRLKTRLHPELIELIESENIVVGMIGDPSPGAYVKTLDSGHAIIFHVGLKDFIYRIARVLATRVQIAETNEVSLPERAIEETTILISDIFWWFNETERACGPEYPIEPNQQLFASMLATEAETFLMAHEIGHVIASAIDHDDMRLLDLSSDIPPVHGEEYTADYIGLCLVMGVHGRNKDRKLIQDQIVYAGVEFALQIYRALQYLGVEFARSHPYSEHRIQNIRDEMQTRFVNESSWANLSVMAYAIERIFFDVVRIHLAPGNHAAFLEREAVRVVAELNSLLDKSAASMVPDYISFYEGAGEIFSRGYSHKMLERAAEVAGDFFAEVGRPIDERTVPDEISIQRINRFKLLFGFIGRMNEPARSLFLNALEKDPSAL